MTYRRRLSFLVSMMCLLPTLAFLLACRSEKGRDGDEGERKAYALLLEVMEHNALGEKQVALALADSALGMNPADTTRSWLTSEKMVAYVDQGMLREGIAIGKSGIPFAEKINDYEGMLAMCGAMGVCYRRIGDVDSSLFYYEKGLQKAIEDGNTEYEIYLCNCISVLFNEQKRYSEAIDYSDKAEQKALAINDTIERLSAHANKGSILLRQGLCQESVDMLVPLWEQVRKVNYNILTLKYLSPLLSAYLRLGKTDSVALYMPYADEACKGLPPTTIGVLGILEIKADMLARQRKYAEEKLLLDSMGNLSNINMAMPQGKYLALRAECLNNLGQHEEAYKVMRNAYEHSDSLKQSDIDRQLSEFNVKYNTLEKKVELEKMNNERIMLYSRISWLAVALVVLSVVFAAVLYRRKLDRQRAELSEKMSYINGVETERMRLAKELHDGVCNDILAVSIMMQTDQEEAERMLRNVGHDVRRLSHELIPPRFDNTSLPELIRVYCQSVSGEGGPVVRPVISASFEKLVMPATKAIEVYRIVQECVSNAIKYGYSKMVTVTLDSSGQQATVSIVNDLSPSHPVRPNERGVGKDTLRIRVDALQAELRTENSNDQYQVEVTFPL